MRERLRGAVSAPRLRLFAESTPLSRLVSMVIVAIIVVSMLFTLTHVFAQGPATRTPMPPATKPGSAANGVKNAVTKTPTAPPPNIPADIASKPLLAQDVTLDALGITSYE